MPKLLSISLRAIVVGLIGLAGISRPAWANHPVDIHNAAQVAAGKAVYEENCAACHGRNLTGPDNPKDFKRLPPRLDARRGHAAHHNDQDLYNQIVRGSRDKQGRAIDDGMPAFGEILKPEQIWAVLSYIKSRWPADVFRRQNMMNPGHGGGMMGGGHMGGGHMMGDGMGDRHGQ